MHRDLFGAGSDAIFSECRKYRYVLTRVWDVKLPPIMFIGLNPSTASENMDDPTIRRVKRFARDWGYGSVFMMNLFSIVSSDPKILLTPGLDLQMDNDKWLNKIWNDYEPDVLFAWGNFKEAVTRAKEIEKKFPDAVCLGVNKNGTPKHPLYVAANTKTILFKPRESHE